MTLGECGTVVITGSTRSEDFPVTVVGNSFSGQEDVFIASLLDPKDTDKDGIADGWEDQMGLNATDSLDASQDKDGDGLPNIWEYQMGLNASDPRDAGFDPDADGLTNLEEHEARTLPYNPDTDGDGLLDGDEVFRFFLNPLVDDATTDTDHDGLSNVIEVLEWETDPRRLDTDGDGLSDGEEVLVWHTAPLSTDTDGDGVSDGFEARWGSDPTSRLDTPLFRGLILLGASCGWFLIFLGSVLFLRVQWIGFRSYRSLMASFQASGTLSRDDLAFLPSPWRNRVSHRLARQVVSLPAHFVRMDVFERQVLQALQHDGWLPLAEVARRANVPRSVLMRTIPRFTSLVLIHQGVAIEEWALIFTLGATKALRVPHIRLEDLARLLQIPLPQLFFLVHTLLGSGSLTGVVIEDTLVSGDLPASAAFRELYMRLDDLKRDIQDT